MKIKDMFERILIRSGQFIMAKSKVEMDDDSFRILVEDALAVYSKSHPFEKFYVINSVFPRTFTFDEYFDPEMKRVPDWISEVNPATFSGISLANFYQGNSNYPGQRSELVIPTECPWTYRKPVLTVPFSSKYEVKAVFKHRVTKVPNLDPNCKIEYEVITINEDDSVFFKLLQAYFLQGIGRSRRAFTLNDLPIIMDADAIASEGKELENEAKEELQNTQKFYLAMG